MDPLARSNSELTSESVDLVSIWYAALDGVSTHRILCPQRATQTHKFANVHALKKGIRTRDPTVRAVKGMTHPVSYDQHYSKSYGAIWWRDYVKHIAKTGRTKLSSYIKN